MNRLVTVAWAMCLALSVHMSASAAAPVPFSTALPRFSAESEQFELVGVIDGQLLRLYLDQFGSNAPVAKAQLEVESGAWKAVATEVSPAVYTVSAEHLLSPGKHLLTITVQAGDSVDLLDASLEIGAAEAPISSTRWPAAWAVWGTAAALLLAGVGLVYARQRKH